MLSDRGVPGLSRLSVPEFQRLILDWYALHRRHLPWRGAHDPYYVLVSEVMLQQTGVGRVSSKYAPFLQRFPDLGSLSTATTAEVLVAWRGLGYNRRALNLKRLAMQVTRDHGGRLPESIDALMALPGVGQYTAHAVACFAYGQQVPVVDVNVRRVLSAFAGHELSLTAAWETAETVIPLGRAQDWNQGLMDFGAAELKWPHSVTNGGVPFRETDRFWRGRIVDTLRDGGSLPVVGVLHRLPKEGLDESRVRRLLLALHEEGLARYIVDRDEVRLPD